MKKIPAPQDAARGKFPAFVLRTDIIGDGAHFFSDKTYLWRNHLVKLNLYIDKYILVT